MSQHYRICRPVETDVTSQVNVVLLRILINIIQTTCKHFILLKIIMTNCRCELDFFNILFASFGFKHNHKIVSKNTVLYDGNILYSRSIFICYGNVEEVPIVVFMAKVEYTRQFPISAWSKETAAP